jgi:hypothetical protein
VEPDEEKVNGVFLANFHCSLAFCVGDEETAYKHGIRGC